MKKYVVERILPGAGNLSQEELRMIAKSYCDTIRKMGKPYHWIQTFITEDKIYCIHIAENEEVIREHSRMSNFPINTISEVKMIIDPQTDDI